MNNNDIYISGLTPLNKIPKSIYSLPHKKTCLTHKLTLSKNRPEIKKILGLKIKTSVSSYKKSFTSSSSKTIVNAIYNIEVTYYSTTNTVHTAKFNIPFAIPITLKNSTIIVKNVLNYITNSSIKMLNRKSFLLYSTVFCSLLLGNKSPQKTYNKKNSTQNFNNQQLNHDINHKNLNKPQRNSYNLSNNYLKNITNNKNLNNKKSNNKNFTNQQFKNTINSKNSNNRNFNNKKNNINLNNTQSNKYLNSKCNICWDSYYCLILVLVLLSKFSPFPQRPYRYCA